MSLIGPHPHATGLDGLALAAALWFGMMVAMMLPALMPWLRVFGKMADRAWPGRTAAVVVAQFAGGYFAIWLAYSVVAAVAQGGLQYFTLLRLDLSVGATVGGALLIVAGIFQLTPLKDACLAHCRSPLGFFLARWDDGPRGPFKMGARHGVWCVGCCWALMAVSFVLGVMNLVWMALLTAMIVAEQRAPRRWRLGRAFGVMFVVWGIGLIAIDLS